MKNTLNDLSEVELAAMIENAQKALKTKQESKRKDVILKIKELAASIGMNAELTEAGKVGSRKGSTVPIKYSNPANPNNKWTGRGMKPKWLRELLEQGHSLEEFEV